MITFDKIFIVKQFLMFSENSNFLLFGFFIVINAFNNIPVSAQPGTWVAVYGGNQYDRGRGIVETFNKGYAICGSSSSYGMGNTDFYLLKLDSLGKYEWQNTFGGLNIEDAYSLKQTSDSGYVIAGFTNSIGEGGYDVFVVKTNSKGIFQWQKTYGGSDWDFAYWIEQTMEGGYIIAGETFSFGSNPHAYLIKTNSLGDTLWTKTFGHFGKSAFKEVHQTADSGFIAAGYTQTALNDMDFYLVKTDKNGNTLWEKTYGNSADEICNSVAICSDGGFLLGGHRDTNGTHKTYFLKTDSNGNLIMSKAEMTLNGNRSIVRIRQTIDDGQYVFLQNTDVGGLGGQEIRLDKYNTGGWFLWGKTAGGVYNDEGYDLIQTIDSGFAFIGFTASYGAGPDNIFFVKTASDGNYNSTINTYVSVNDIIVSGEVDIFPNPSSGKIFLKGFEEFEVKVYSPLGTLIKYENKASFGVLLDNIDSGIYLIEIKKENTLARKKIILMK